MIDVMLCRKNDGSFAECTVEGHAEFSVIGSDIVCAAVTAIVRTAAGVLVSTKGGCSSVTIAAPERGKLVFRATEKCSIPVELLTYTADFIQKGIEQIICEYPQCVQIRVKIVK